MQLHHFHETDWVQSSASVSINCEDVNIISQQIYLLDCWSFHITWQMWWMMIHCMINVWKSARCIVWPGYVVKPDPKMLRNTIFEWHWYNRFIDVLPDYATQLIMPDAFFWCERYCTNILCMLNISISVKQSYNYVSFVMVLLTVKLSIITYICSLLEVVCTG